MSGTRHPLAKRPELPDPIWSVLRRRGLRKVDLAEAARYSLSYVSLVSYGRKRLTPEFRRACSRYLGLPERQLFLDDAERARRLELLALQERPRGLALMLEPEELDALEALLAEVRVGPASYFATRTGGAALLALQDKIDALLHGRPAGPPTPSPEAPIAKTPTRKPAYPDRTCACGATFTPTYADQRFHGRDCPALKAETRERWYGKRKSARTAATVGR